MFSQKTTREPDPMPEPDKTDEEVHFHRHGGVIVPTMALYVNDTSEDEEPKLHQHFGQDVLVHNLYVKHQHVPVVMEVAGKLCPVCGFEPTPAFAAFQQFKLPVVLPVLLEDYRHDQTRSANA